jgi:hypothetical protein
MENKISDRVDRARMLWTSATRAQRYRAVGAALGAVEGTWLLWAALAKPDPPPFMLEGMAVLYAPPFGLFVSYPIRFATEILGSARFGFLAWMLLTPPANWGLVGWLLGRHLDGGAHNRASRPAV